MNKKRIFGIILLSILLIFMYQSMSNWIMNIVHSLLLLWDIVQLLEMPHKFYGLTIMLFIFWKILEAVLNIWIKGIEYSIKLIKDDVNATEEETEEEK